MVDLNMMLQEHARTGLQTQLDTAVTNGDLEAARKVTAEMVKLEAALTPKAPPFTPADITAELRKLDWFGIDPKKSARTIELGKSMDLKKFGTAAELAAALVKVVEGEASPNGGAAPGGTGTDEEETGAGGDEEETGETEAKPAPKPKRTDGPGDGDANGGGMRRRASGPWTKLSDAPADVQKEVNRTADKFAPKTEDGRKKFIASALGAHYNRAQIAKGKK